MLKGRGSIRWKASSNFAAAVILVLAIMVFVTLLSERHYFRWDMTAVNEHSLTEKTIQVLKNVDRPVVIKAFVREGFTEGEEARRLLNAYHYRCPKVTYELIDPERNPGKARKYKVSEINTYVIEGYGQSQRVKIADEEHITNALIRLTSGETKKVYWLTGHGERLLRGSEPDSFGLLNERLGNQNFDVKKVNLMRQEIPGDTDLVIVAAPEKPLLEAELESLAKFINQGGRVIIFLEPYKDGGLRRLVESYGIVIADDIIVDKMSRAMGGDYLLPMVANYGKHELTEEFRLTSLFSVARSIEAGEEPSRYVSVTGLAYTSSDSWSERDRESVDAGEVELDKGDKEGPITLAAIAELIPPIKKEREQGGKGSGNTKIRGKGKLVVFGDADFATNRFFELAGNGDFILNTINYLVEREEHITIRKKHRPIETLVLTRTQGRLIFLVPVVLMPLLVVVLGVFVWYRRRSR